MLPQATSPVPKRESVFNPIVFTGILVGSLDAIAAILNFIIPTYRDPVRIFQYIASGVFGKEVAFSNSVMPWLGVLFHFAIAFSWTTLFFLLYPRVAWLRKNTIATGMAYGVVIWLGMNLIILPLSRVTQFPLQLKSAAMGMAILILCVGLPISIRAHRYYSKV